MLHIMVKSLCSLEPSVQPSNGLSWEHRERVSVIMIHMGI